MGRIKPENHTTNKSWNDRYWRKGKRGWLHGAQVLISKTAKASGGGKK